MRFSTRVLLVYGIWVFQMGFVVYPLASQTRIAEFPLSVSASTRES